MVRLELAPKPARYDRQPEETIPEQEIATVEPQPESGSTPEEKLLAELREAFLAYSGAELPTARVRALLRDRGFHALNVYYAEKVMQGRR